MPTNVALSDDALLEQYENVKQRLANIENERADYEGLVKHYESLLHRRGITMAEKLHGSAPAVETSKYRGNTAIFVQTILDANGRINAEKICAEAEKRGARIGGENLDLPGKLRIVDGTLKGVAKRPGSPIKSLGKRWYKPREKT